MDNNKKNFFKKMNISDRTVDLLPGVLGQEAKKIKDKDKRDQFILSAINRLSLFMPNVSSTFEGEEIRLGPTKE